MITGEREWLHGESSRTSKRRSLRQRDPRKRPRLSRRPPPLPSTNKSQQTGEKTSGGASLAGAIVFVIGALTLLSGLTGSPDGSAIRQGVLAQHMTNGILLMILGKLLSTK